MFKLLLTMVMAVSAAPTLHAQEAWPSRPIKFIVPTPPGGPTDQVARVLADKLATALGQPIVVDNRAGAGHLVGMTATAQSAPDGYTFGIVSTPLVVSPALHAKMPYDTARDLVPVSLLTNQPLIMVTRGAAPYKTVRDVVAAAKAKPRSLNMASPGSATGPHLAGELLNTVSGMQVTHVPYKGGPQATLATVSGETDFYFDTPNSSLPLIRDGRLRALAVSSPARMAALPDVPTVAESGFAGYDFNSFIGLVAPRGVPPAVLARLQSEIAKSMVLPDVKSRLTTSGFESVGGTSQDFATMIAAELPKWRKVVTEAKITAE
ncbi:MAG: tripartite tricarboxylate transporter substrate binding protein [Pseudomonadota bacterium]